MKFTTHLNRFYDIQNVLLKKSIPQYILDVEIAFDKVCHKGRVYKIAKFNYPILSSYDTKLFIR
jgi:hypothetical protein